jgi:DNA-binding GntR family transcriptional regulator
MEGLVRRQPNQGCSVTELSLEEQNQIFYLRVELESMAAELAVRNREAWKSEGPSLSRILNEFRQAANKENLEEFLRADIEFHKTIWRFSGNTFLERALSQITVPQLAFGAIKVLSHPGRSWISIVADHEDVARSLVAGGEDKAKQVVRRMLQEYWEKTITIHAPKTGEHP